MIQMCSAVSKHYIGSESEISHMLGPLEKWWLGKEESQEFVYPLFFL